jgi:hypothetical protein
MLRIPSLVVPHHLSRWALYDLNKKFRAYYCSVIESVIYIKNFMLPIKILYHFQRYTGLISSGGDN